MKKRYFYLFCIFSVAFSQSALGMVTSLFSLKKGEKRVAFIMYEGAFQKKECRYTNVFSKKKETFSFCDDVKAMESEKTFFLENCDKDYFPCFDAIVERQRELYNKKNPKKIDFITISSAQVLFPSGRGAFWRALYDKYLKNSKNPGPFSFIEMPDLFFPFLYFHDYANYREFLFRTEVSDKGILLKNNKQYSLPFPSECSFDRSFLNRYLKGRIRSVSSYIKEMSEVIQGLKGYCSESRRLIKSDMMERAMKSTESLVSLFETCVQCFGPRSSLLSCLVGISMIDSEDCKWEDLCSPQQVLVSMTNFAFLRNLFLILKSQDKQNLTFVFLEERSNSVKEICEELKHLGYGDDIKTNFIPKTWRPIPSIVFEIFINRVLGCCNVCGKPSKKRCARCKATYCSKECQKKDWGTQESPGRHMEICLKFKKEMAKEKTTKK